MREWLKNLANDIVRDVGHEIKEQGRHGAHEAAAALFNGSAFVMYPRGSHDGGQVPEQPQIEHEREM
jgi:hypothetical protein